MNDSVLAPHDGGRKARAIVSTRLKLWQRGRYSVAWPTIILGVLLFWMVGLPLIMLLTSSLKPTGFPLSAGWSVGHYARVYLDPSFYSLTFNTLIFAAGSILIAMFFGTLIAWLVERTDIPFRPLIRTVVILPIATPPVLLAISWTMLIGPRTGFFNQILQGAFGLESPPFNIYSMAGMIFVEGLAMVPSAFLLMAPSFRNIDPTLEDAAAASGASVWFTMRRVVLPLLTPALLASCMFLAIISFVVFDVPGTLGMPVGIYVLSSRIYRLLHLNTTGLPDYGMVSAMAVLFLALLLIMAFGYQRAVKNAGRFVTLTGKGFRPRQFKLKRLRWLAVGVVFLYFSLAVLAPLGVLLWTSLMPYQIKISLDALSLASLANHRAFFANEFAFRAALNSVVIALVSATAVTMLSMLVSWVVVRSKAPGRKIVDLATFIPVAIPGVMLSVALIQLYSTMTWFRAYGTIWIIAIAYATTFLSFGSRSTNSVMMQLHPDLEDAARTAGAGWLRVGYRIVVPLLGPALIAVWIWVLAHAMRELTSALMLQGLDNQTLPVLLWGYWAGGEPTKTAAVGVWLVAALFIVVAGWQIIAERSRVRTQA
jgi:iron(III) transport system permease protein